ncbi:MAG: RNA 2',3'-cyclic phosphodiesterase [Patescibacteria group bacterium]
MERLFVAFKLSDEARREVERVQRELERLNLSTSTRIKWTGGEHHLTLAFLGDCDETQKLCVQENLGALSGAGAFSLTLGQLDAFPNMRAPRVLVIHCDDEKGSAASLANRVREPVIACGIPQENRAFKPHVTLGRVRQSGVRVQGLDTITVEPVKFEVNEIGLYASELLPDGPKHTALLRVSL